MKTKFLFTVILIFSVFINHVIGQDLISCTSCWITPTYSYNSSTHEISIDDMVIKNQGWYDATEFDVAVFIKNTDTGTEYELDRVTYSGLGYQTNQNQEPISGWNVDLDFESVPTGTYKIQIKINDDQKAYETSYTNNTEYFSNTSFNYTSGTSNVNNTRTFNKLNVCYNPSDGIFFIEGAYVENAQVRVFNSIGNIIWQQACITDKTISFNTKHLPKGIYFMEIQKDGKIMIEKLFNN